jgi:transmembrane sensor
MMRAKTFDPRGKLVSAPTGSFIGQPRVLRMASPPSLTRSSPMTFVATPDINDPPFEHSDVTRRRRAHPRWPRPRWFVGFAAATALASSAGFVDPMHVRYYETAVGEHRTIVCQRSSITLNTQSQIAIQCTRNLVRVRLLRGEASFRVPHDASRFLTVLAGDAQVDDIGTIFSVRRLDDRSIVTVIEGSVELSALEPVPSGPSLPGAGLRQLPRAVADMPVWAGERAAVVNTGSKLIVGPQVVTRSQIRGALTWEEGELAFESETLADIVEEVNRYNRTKIEIADPTLRHKRLSLAFKATDLDNFTYELERAGVHAIRVSHMRSPNVIVLS